MIGRLGRHVAIYGLATLLARGTALLMVPILTRLISRSELGIVELGSAAISFSVLVVALEIGQALARYVPDPLFAADRRLIASTALWFAAASYLVVGIIAILILRLTLAEPFRDEGSLVVLAAGTTGIFLIAQGQARWEFKPLAYGLTSVIYAGVTVVATLLLATAGWGAAGAFVGQTVGASVGFVAALVAVRSSVGLVMDRRWLGKMLRFSAPLVPASIGIIAFLNTDRLVIGAVLSLADVAQFGVASRVAATVGVVMSGLQLALIPLIYANHQAPEAPAQLAKIFALVAGLAITAWLALGLLAPEIVSVLATEQYAGAAAIVPLLAPAVILTGMLVFAPGMAIVGRTVRVASLSLAGGAANLVLNLTLVPLYGIRGAAIASVISAGALFAMMFSQSQRYYRLPLDIRRPLVGVAIVALGILASGVLWSAPAPPLWRIAIFVVCVAGLVRARVVRPEWALVARP